MGNRLFYALLFAIFVFGASFYCWTTGATTYGLSRVPGGYYNLLTDALLHGQTSLLEKPAPQLVSLRNPYDPDENKSSPKLHDAVLYGGKYYIYWGVAPVLLLYLPVHLLTGQYLTNGAECAIFTSLGLLFSIMLLAAVRMAFFRASSPWLTASLAALLAFGSMAPVILRRPDVYEAAITGSYGLASVFLYFAYRGAFQGSLKLKYLCSAGVALGLVFICRPPLIAYGLALVVGCLIFRDPRSRPGLGSPKLLALAFGPPLGFAIAQACYNFARFGSPFEYGVRYTLAGLNMSQYQLFSLPRGIYSALSFIFNSPAFSPLFPFAVMQDSQHGLVGAIGLAASAMLPHIPLSNLAEPTVGALVAVPLLVVIIFALLRPRGLPSPLRRFLACILFSATLIAITDSLIGPSVRYELDFLPMFLLVAAILTLWIDQLSKPAWARITFRIATFVAVFYSVSLSAALSMTGYFGARPAPEDFSKLERIFSVVEFMVYHPHGMHYGAVHARVTVPACVPGQIGEPLLVSGISNAGDFFYLHCTGKPDTFVVGWDHWNVAPKYGAEFVLPRGTQVNIDITTPALFSRWNLIGPSRPCIIEINGKEVFRQAPCDVYFNQPWEVFPFSNPIGGSTTAPSYSGKVLSIERLDAR
jgi:hypothetical protein